MSALKKLLVATDFSEQSHAAVEHAIELAKQLDASIVLLHAFVIPVPAIPMLDATIVPTSAMVAHITNQAQAALHKELESVQDRGVPITGLLRDGNAPEVINEVATKEQVDLIILGTHGRGLVGQLLLGSVANRVVRTARCPVLVVPPKKG